MCELSQLTMFYKMNRNWGLLSSVLGSFFIVNTQYSVATTELETVNVNAF